MELIQHTVSALFAQLGLPNEEADIQAFVTKHAPLPDDALLSEAAFWTPAQAKFLRDEIVEDADWAQAVDQLNLMLHH